MRILVTGSRNWKDRQLVLDALQAAIGAADPGTVTVVHGHCPTGADSMADMWARRLGCQVERHPADWSGSCRTTCPPGHRKRDPQRGSGSYCPLAGHYRNQEMVDLGADMVLAFQLNHSRGTQDCIDRARAAGLTVAYVPEMA